MRKFRDRAIAALKLAESMRHELEELIEMLDRVEELEADLATASDQRTAFGMHRTGSRRPQ